MQSDSQKQDMAFVFRGVKNYKNLDYIACWFLLAARLINDDNIKMAFVSTNSISQGEQVALLWGNIFDLDVEIFFAHQSFRWVNNAKGKAGVTCVIIGLRKKTAKLKTLFKDGVSFDVPNISPYLIKGKSRFVFKRTSPLSGIPKIDYGNKAVDGGFLILSSDEKDRLVNNYPGAVEIIRPFIGSSEYIKGIKRYCLWIPDSKLTVAKSIPLIYKRIESVRAMRLASRDEGISLYTNQFSPNSLAI
jgi:hypothetical protein